ncbi:sulfite exporter TauE/SafE family protein [Paraglaciecola sp. 2405UD69-4]|uniref:sulfite exporter TauE/SafE family protein n=1 Tax=Paraglaciecola sp. 2405UD69-4 TaxID=3391836 RepID=UPI0039C9ACDA
MEPFVTIFLFCLLIGAVVGFMAGLLGIGGGLIIVPILLHLLITELGLDLSHAMPMAIATSLFTIILTGFSASRTHYKLGNVDWFITTWSGLGIALGAILGAQLASHISGELLKSIFAFLVFGIACYMLFGKRKASNQEASKSKLTGVGLFAGFLSSLMGIGGGSIMVPSLVWFNISIKKSIGCASVCGVVIAIFGSLSFVQAGWNNVHLPEFSFGYIYLPAAVGIVITSVLTAGIGARVSQKLDTSVLKKVFAGFLTFVSLVMLFG